MKIRQAIQITHINVTQIMGLPPIKMCEKGDDGKYYFYLDSTDLWLKAGEWVEETDWVVQFMDGSWGSYTEEEFKTLQL